MNRLLFTYIFIITFAYFTNNASGEAWLMQKHKGMFIFSNEIRTFKAIDETGKYNNNRRFVQDLLNIYMEYGLTNRITLVGKIIAINSMLTSNNAFLGKIKEKSLGIDTFNISLRHGIIRNNQIIALSIVTGFETPSIYHENRASQFAIKKYKQISGLEVGINIDKNSFFILTSNFYLNINHWYNELRFDVLYGHYFLESILFMVRMQKIFYYIHNSKNEFYNKINTSIYDTWVNSGFAKIQMSFLVPFSKALSLEFGIYSTIKSKILKTQNLNTKMRGFYLSLLFEF